VDINTNPENLKSPKNQKNLKSPKNQKSQESQESQENQENQEKKLDIIRDTLYFTEIFLDIYFKLSLKIFIHRLYS